jgi:predicted amidophosphoribosyltransferase
MIKCKLSGYELHMLGSDRHACCSWCQEEQPYHHFVCWKCSSPIQFEDGVALCESCGKDYITHDAKKEIDGLYAGYLRESAERICHDYSGKD